MTRIDPTTLAKAREWTRLAVAHETSEVSRAAAEVIANLPDHIIDVDKVQEVMEDMAYSLEQNGGPGHDFATARWMSRLEALLPTPKPKTLADLIEEGHDPAQYQWMQAEHRDERCIIIRVLGHDSKLTASLLTATGATIWTSTDEVIPLPDLPCLVWPASEPEPAEEIPTPEVAPKVLTTEEDYRDAPRDTVVKDTTFPFSDVWDKWYENEWRTTTRNGSGKGHTNAEMADTTRQVIWAPEVQA